MTHRLGSFRAHLSENYSVLPESAGDLCCGHVVGVFYDKKKSYKDAEAVLKSHYVDLSFAKKDLLRLVRRHEKLGCLNKSGPFEKARAFYCTPATEIIAASTPVEDVVSPSEVPSDSAEEPVSLPVVVEPFPNTSLLTPCSSRSRQDFTPQKMRMKKQLHFVSQQRKEEKKSHKRTVRQLRESLDHQKVCKSQNCNMTL